MKDLKKEIAKKSGTDQILKSHGSRKFVDEHINFDDKFEIEIDDFLEGLKKFLIKNGHDFDLITIKFVINKYIDKNSSGTIDPQEIEDFFVEVWNKPDMKAKFLEDIKTNPELPENINEFTIIRQLLCETNLEKFYDKFASQNITSKSLLSYGTNTSKIAGLLK